MSTDTIAPITAEQAAEALRDNAWEENVEPEYQEAKDPGGGGHLWMHECGQIGYFHRLHSPTAGCDAHANDCDTRGAETWRRLYVDVTPKARKLIHCLMGLTGADWDLIEALALVARADDCAWRPSIVGHDLAVVADGHVYFFEAKRPATEVTR